MAATRRVIMRRDFSGSTAAAAHFAGIPAMSHFLADDGARIHVAVDAAAADGLPVVMLHGWTASADEWTPFLPAITTRHPVYRWDARGHGRNNRDSPATHPTVQRMARAFDQLLAHFGLDRVVVVGHSMGALPLWQYIRDFGTARLAKVCLIDQSPRLVTDGEWTHGIYGDFDPARSRAFVDDLRADFPEAVLRLTALGLNPRAREKYLDNARGWQRSREALAGLDPDPLIACWESLVAADYLDVLTAIDVPALLVYGGESNFYHSATAHYVASAIPDAILNIYEGTDHSPHQWQRERFARELVEFINE